MTHTPDARPVSEADLAERIAEVERRAELCVESFGSAPAALLEKLSILRELQSLRASLRDAQDAFVTQSARLVQAETRIASLEKDAGRLRGSLSAAEGSLAKIDYRSTPESTVRDTVTNLKMMLRAAIYAAMKERV